MSKAATVDVDSDVPPPKKKGKKLLVLAIALVVLGGGTGGGLYAMGIIGGGAAEASAPGPKLVLKSGQKRGATPDGEGHGGSEGEAAAATASHGQPTPAGSGGDAYASNYYQFEKDFTSNLKDSDRFVQLGLALSTPYDDTVIEHLKTNVIAVRSAVLMTLGDASEDDVVDSAAKEKLAKRLAVAINAALKQKEGFGGVGNVYFTNFVVQ